MHRFMAVVLVSLLAVFPQGAAGSTAAPLDVEATVVADSAVVTWVPSPLAAGPDVSYRVYGESQGGLVFLAEVPPDTKAIVDGSYEGYAVATVMGGVESEPTPSRDGACIDAAPGQIPPYYIHNCGLIFTVRRP